MTRIVNILFAEQPREIRFKSEVETFVKAAVNGHTAVQYFVLFKHNTLVLGKI